MEDKRTKILLLYTAAGAFVGATLRYQLEKVDADKYKALRVVSTNIEFYDLEKAGFPVKYMSEQQFQIAKDAGDFYWIAKTDINQPYFGILKEDVIEALNDKEVVSYILLSLSDCVEIKRQYPDDVCFLASNEWNDYDEVETEDTKLMRKEADYFIDSFNVDALDLLEKIRRGILGIYD